MELLFSFAMSQLNSDLLSSDVKLMSLYNDKILIGCDLPSYLYIYNEEGRRLLTIKIEKYLYDVTWTPCGNIVFMTLHSQNVVLMPEPEQFISQTYLSDPRYFNVFKDDVIYLIDYEDGVYQSTDDGATWSFILEPTDQYKCWQVITVTTDHNVEYWTLEKTSKSIRLRVNSVDDASYMNNVMWKDISFPKMSYNENILSAKSTLTYDGIKNIFLGDYHNN